MGTRSLLIVKDGRDTLINMYRQYDGYPSGAGAEIAEFLDGMAIVNGFGSHTPKKAANGMGCLAAQLVCHFKQGEIGGFYMYPASARNCGQEYIYTITYSDKNGLRVRCQDGEGNTLFFGGVEKFKKFCAKGE